MHDNDIEENSIYRNNDEPNTNSENNYACVLCTGTVSFLTAAQLNIHLRNSHSFSPLVLCSLCNMSFSLVKYCKKHCELVHNVTQTFFRYECCCCPKQLNDKKVMDAHIMSQHYYSLFPRLRPFLCTTCGVTVIGLEKFVSHLQNHFVLCNSCPAMFKTPEEFFNHYKLIHSNFLKCGICCCLITDFEMYLSHIEKHNLVYPSTPVNPEEDKAKSYVCTVCDEFFVTRNGFLYHFFSHNLNTPADKNNNN